MALDDELLELLVCPETKEPLVYFEDEQFLLSPEAGLRYPIEDDIPVMLPEEAEEVDEDELDELLERAESEGLRWTAQDEPEADEATA